MFQELFDLSTFEYGDWVDEKEPDRTIRCLPAMLRQYYRWFCNNEVDFTNDIHPSAEIDENVIIGPNARIGAGVVIKGPAIIGPETIIGASSFIQRAIIGTDCFVGNNTFIGRSIIIDFCQIGDFSKVLESIVGKRVTLGNQVVTTNYYWQYQQLHLSMIPGSKVTDRKRKWMGAQVGDDSSLGDGCQVYPFCTIGKRVHADAGAHLHGSYPPDSWVKVLPTQERVLH